MKNFILSTLFILISTFVYSQKSVDVIHLKNGSIIRGTIVEQVPNEFIKVETSDRSVYTYKMDEIEKFTREVDYLSENNSGYQFGYKGIVETGFQIGVGKFKDDRVKVNVINGIQINPHLYIGQGLGFRYYIESDVVAMPIFVDIRTHFINRKISPYFSLDIGYTLNASDDFSGMGLIVAPTAGASFKFTKNFGLLVGLGYEMQKADTISYYYYYYDYKNVNFGAINLHVGITF